MELFVKTLQELTPEELFEIYKLRVSVFVVEQKCPYQEVDDADKVAYHVWMKDEDGIQAYLRVLPKGATFDECSIETTLRPGDEDSRRRYPGGEGKASRRESHD